MIYKKWTTDEITRVDELRHQGFTRREIAGIMGVTISQINGICNKRLSRITRAWTTGENAAICRMTAEGKNAREIGEALGYSAQTINTRKYLMRKKVKNEPARVPARTDPNV